MMTHPILGGKRIVVTGASSGIGRGMALVFGAAGAELFITANEKTKCLDDVATLLRERGTTVHSAICDLRDPAQIDWLFDEVANFFPGLDVLVNNAGSTERRPVMEIDVGHFDRIIQTNLRAPLLCSLCAAKLMGVGGKIINISSFQATSPTQNSVVYSASKAGLNGLTRSLALELAPMGIRVNSLSPGWIVVEKDAPMTPEEEAAYSEFIPFGRLGRVGDIAEMAAFLASDASQFTTGADIVVDGGQSVPLHFPARNSASPVG